jgi:hypothetical protein
MPAITDADELAEAQAQLAAQGATPAPAASTATPQQWGPIMDPDEMAAARTQLNSAQAPKVATPADPSHGQTLQATPDRGFLGAIDDTARMLTSKIPFIDRFSAGMDTLAGTGLPGADYAKNLQNERLKDAAVAEQHPVLSKILGLGGGAAGVIATLPEQAVVAPTMAARALAGAATGAGYGAVSGASDTPDLTNIPDASRRIAIGAATGAAAGGATPLVAGGIGSAYTAGANAITGGTEGISRRAAAPLMSAIEADTPQAVQGTVGRLGDQSMLADAGPALLGKTQGVAINSDDARSVLGTALGGRDAGTNARLASDINSAIGPAQSPLQASQALQAQRSQIHGQLPQIFAAAPPVDTTGVLSQIGQGLNKAVGPEAAVLSRARDYLMRDDVDAAGNPIRVPVTDAETLQNAKMALDTLIDRGDPTLGVVPGAISKSQGAIADVRRQLNGALRGQVPGYSDVMDQSSALAKQMEAIESGNSLLGSGQNAVSPADLNAQMQGMAPEQIQGLRTGVRAAIDRTVGTKANDLVALRNAMQGEGGWNEAKLSDIFGAAPTGQIADSIDRNSAFRSTYQNVVQNSQTAQRQAAAAAMKPGAATGGIPYINPNMTLTGAVTTPVKALGNALLSQLRPDPTRAYGEMARILSAQGPQRDDYLSALLDTMNRRGRNAAAGRAVGNNSAMAAALIGGQVANDQLQGR